MPSLIEIGRHPVEAYYHRPPIIVPETRPWVGRKITIACWSGVGRGAMFRALFSARFPNIEAVNVGIEDVSHRYKHPHQLVIEEMLRQGLDISNYPVRALSEDDITPDTDFIAFVDKIYLPPFVRNARSISTFNVHDPPELVEEGRAPSLRAAILIAYEEIRHLIYGPLRNCVLLAQNKTDPKLQGGVLDSLALGLFTPNLPAREYKYNKL